MSKVAIKVVTESGLNKYLVPIRKHTGLAISEIKSKIENRTIIAETDANNIDDMEKLRELVDNLIKLGAVVIIFDSDVYGEATFNYQEISLQEFNNNIKRLKEILEEVQDYDDAVADDHGS